MRKLEVLNEQIKSDMLWLLFLKCTCGSNTQTHLHNISVSQNLHSSSCRLVWAITRLITKIPFQHYWTYRFSSQIWQQDATSDSAAGQLVPMFAEQHRLWKQNKPHPLMSSSVWFVLTLLRGAILSLGLLQEMNSSLIPGTSQHFHYHSFLTSPGLVQFVIISKQHKYVNSLENTHTRDKKKKKKKNPKHFLSTAQCFFFPHSSAVQKNEGTRKKTTTKKTINRLPLLYISLFKYIHI